ncbi:MAG TPA: magnesium transporter CorA family protein [Bellilinea sp.]|nr:magnesium transporter CorA family protein [Bellilinea sp.]
MITIYKSSTNGLEQINEFTSGCWVNMIDPTSDDIERMAGQGIPQDFMTYPLDMDERARSEREDDGKMLILIRIPFFQGLNVDVPYTTMPLGLILTDAMIVTVCRRQNDLTTEFASGKIKNLSTGKRIRFVLRMLLLNANRFLSHLRQINKMTEDLEDRLQQSMQNKEVLELLKYQKSLVYFTTALKANELLLERLQRTQLFRQYSDDEDLLEDVITENQQAIEMVNISSNILSSMMDAFASIISNNLNVVMKFLASVTILVSLPAIVTGFYGMNVDLPFQTLPFTWVGILGVCLLVVGVTIFLFFRKRWF